MTKGELIEQLANVADDADVYLAQSYDDTHYNSMPLERVHHLGGKVPVFPVGDKPTYLNVKSIVCLVPKNLAVQQ